VEQLYGYPLDDLIGEPVFSLNASPGDTQAIQTHLLETGSWTGEVEQQRRDGSTFPALVSLFTVTDESGDVDSAVAAVRDITEEQRMEEQLRQQERLAAVGQLAGGIAHDFNNILAAIMLYAEMPLSQPTISPVTRNALDTILEESHRAADLIQQILDFSRSAMMDTQALDLVDLVEETASLLRRTIPENITLTVESPSDGCTIQADPTRIHQALMNLALNAKDAMPEGGKLRLAVESVHVTEEAEAPMRGMAVGAWARLTVSDTGTGMTREVEEHLFEPFFTTKEQGKGTGLGLAQVYGIVKQHEGFIDVDTTWHEGTTFTIYLPAEAAAAGEQKDHVAETQEGRGETILVVEDAEGLRGAIRAGLTSVGYRVLTAADGREALDLVAEQDVDLVLTDVVMPRMGGEALLRRLRRDYPALKLVAMTGHVMDKDLRELHASGFSAALPKPFSIEELTHVVRSVLDRG
jgi:PAS domain S-box-containing protein